MAHARRGSRPLIAVTLAVLASGLFAAWIGLGLGGAEVTLWVDDVATPLAALAACLLCFRACARHTGRMRTFWGLFGCAMACWTVAEVIWGVYALILSREVPVPSWADVGYLTAIPLAIAGLVVHPAMSGNGTRKARSVLDGTVIATALLFLSWTLVLGPLWRSSDLGTWGGIVGLAYPFGDVVIVFFIVLAIRGMTGGDRLSLWCLLVALLVMALSDSTYTYLTEVANYSSSQSNLIDVGWFAAYLGIAIAALSSEAHAVELPQVELSRPSLPSLVSPLLPMLLALGVLAVEVRLGNRLDRASWLMAFGLIALVLARQGLLVKELLEQRSGTRTGLLVRLTDTALGGALADEKFGSTTPGSSHELL
jgi:hypothetical protein